MLNCPAETSCETDINAPRTKLQRFDALTCSTGKIFVSVYNIQDETGQFKPYPASNFSTAVPQSATAMLVTALKDSRWFIPLERQGLQNLLNERKIIRAAQENGTVAMNNRIPLQSLTAANIMVEGSIIGYESNVKSGGSAQDISVLALIPVSAGLDCCQPARG